MRWMLLLVVLVGCAQPDTQAAERIAVLEARQADLIEQVEALSARVEALEEPAPEPAPAPLAVPTRPAPRPAPAPLPVTPKPVPTGPTGRIQIAAPRRGLAIWLDGVATDEQTPAILETTPGPHTVKVEGYPKADVTVEQGDTVMYVPR